MPGYRIIRNGTIRRYIHGGNPPELIPFFTTIPNPLDGLGMEAVTKIILEELFEKKFLRRHPLTTDWLPNQELLDD